MILPAGETILGDCSAVIFAPNDLTTAAMIDLGGRLGFAKVVNYPQVGELPGNTLIYFLVHGLLPDAGKQRVMQALRRSAETRRRYAPVVCVLTKGPRHQVVPLVQMGFDEVLFTEDGTAQMRQKLESQIRQEWLYIQSPHYFGPDRRRIELVDPNDPRRKPGGSSFRRIRVLRDPQKGISAFEDA